MSSNHHIGNSADSARCITLDGLKGLLEAHSERLNALEVIFERFQHHACALADADLTKLTQCELAGLATAGSCVVAKMFDDVDCWQNRTHKIETTVAAETYDTPKRLADLEGVDPETLASLIVQQQIQHPLNQPRD